MEFRTKVDIPRATFSIAPCERMLFVGSCFADNMGRKFAEDKFRAVVNPFGVMYNPSSIMHTVERYEGEAPRVAVLTLGTNHIYILRETGEIVDNCNKRPLRRSEGDSHRQSDTLRQVRLPRQHALQSHPAARCGHA